MPLLIEVALKQRPDGSFDVEHRGHVIDPLTRSELLLGNKIKDAIQEVLNSYTSINNGVYIDCDVKPTDERATPNAN